MTAQGTEARRGETAGLDAKRDGPVGTADAPSPLYQEGYSMPDNTDRLASVSSASAEGRCDVRLALAHVAGLPDSYAKHMRPEDRWSIDQIEQAFTLLALAASPEPVPATNQAGEVEGRFWLIVHEPGKVPDRKGSWPRSQLPQIMREFIAARPSAYLTVLTVGADGTPDVQHGPEALQMADGRSMRTGRSHNARTLAAHTASLANHPATSQEGEARFLQALERIRDTPDNLVPSVTIQRMRNIAEFALLGEVLP